MVQKWWVKEAIFCTTFAGMITVNSFFSRMSEKTSGSLRLSGLYSRLVYVESVVGVPMLLALVESHCCKKHRILKKLILNVALWTVLTRYSSWIALDSQMHWSFFLMFSVTLINTRGSWIHKLLFSINKYRSGTCAGFVFPTPFFPTAAKMVFKQN